MKIIFLTEGGGDKGLGHLSRCLALAQAMQQKLSNNIEFFVNGDEILRNFFPDTGIQIFIKNWLIKKSFLVEKLAKAHLVVIDSYLAMRSLYVFVAKIKVANPRLKIMAIDDYQRLSYPVDYVLNPCIYADKLDYRTGYLSSKQPKFFLGQDYIILRDNFWSVKPKTASRSIRDILIIFGGTGHPDLIMQLLDVLVQKYPKANFHVVLNFGQKLGALRMNRVRCYCGLSAKEMLNMMERSDVAITSGGQALYELARVGIPAVGVCMAENQYQNCLSFQRLGFLQFAGRVNEKDIIGKITMSLESLNRKEIRQKKSVVGQSLIDGKGVSRILKQLQLN